MRVIWSLDDEIAWWTKKAYETESDAAYIAFGVATGLKLAKADYGARDPKHRIRDANNL